MKHIVVIGATKGIGLGVIRYLNKSGWNITFTGTTRKGVKAIVEELGENSLGIVCDIRKYKDLENVAKKATKKFGNIDVWYNNAGIDQERNLIKDISIENIDKLIDINVKGTILGSKVALNLFSKQGYGTLYNIEGLGSDGRKISHTVLYGTSKRALRYFTLALKKEVEPGIKIGTISPGMVLTDLLKNGMTEESKKIMNILADKVEVVTPFIGENIINGNLKIVWLNNFKVILRFLKNIFIKRNIF